MRRLLGLPVAVIVITGGLTGCGSGAQNDVVEVVASASFLSEVAERTADQPTGRFETTYVVESVGGDEDEQLLSSTSVGEYDGDADRMRADTTVEVPESAVVEGTPEGPIDGETVLDGTTIYVSGYGYPDDSWVQIEIPPDALSDVQEAQGIDPSVGAVATPGQQLEILGETSDDVEEVGRGDVRGVSTTQLHATTREVGDPQSEEGTYIPSAEVDVWVDEDGLVRRLDQEIVFLGTRTTVSSEFFDFGTPVEIVVPEDATPIEDIEPRDFLSDEELQDIDEQVEEELGPPPPGTEDLVEQMTELTPEQLAEDPCQAFDDDPALQAECEMYLG
jgi:hypothetical protein